MKKEAAIFKVRRYSIKSDHNLPPVRVMITGDWHVSPIVSEQQCSFLQQAIDQIKPEIIVLQGDLVDSPVELTRKESLKKLLKQLKLCSAAAPTVMVVGSHDFVTPTRPAVVHPEALDTWREICTKTGVHFLQNEWFETDKIRVFGAHQTSDFCLEEMKTKHQTKDQYLVHSEKGQKIFEQSLEQYQDQLKNLDHSKTNWLLMHCPVITEKTVELAQEFDVISCGHTHGGIVPLGLDEIFEKLHIRRGLVSPGRKILPAEMRGIRELITDTKVIINPGMIGAHYCDSAVFQNLNFVKAAEVTSVSIESKQS